MPAQRVDFLLANADGVLGLTHMYISLAPHHRRPVRRLTLRDARRGHKR
jgi:hypothetical protein